MLWVLYKSNGLVSLSKSCFPNFSTRVYANFVMQEHPRILLSGNIDDYAFCDILLMVMDAAHIFLGKAW